MSAAGKSPRLGLLDLLRGWCVVNMVCFHALYDLVYMKGIPLPWYTGLPGYLWQQSICWGFILLSGFCWSLSRRPLKHGLLLTGCGALVTLVTYFVMPEELIQYGVLTLLGLSALLLIPLEKLFQKVKLSPWLGLGLSALLFFLTRGVSRGYLGFEGLRLCSLPSFLYSSDLPAVLGFSSPTFFSTDYFPLLPWFFLYLTGFFLWKLLSSSERALSVLRGPAPAVSTRETASVEAGNAVPDLKSCRYYTTALFWKPLAFIGRHSLLIYLLHQPLLVAIFSVI